MNPWSDEREEMRRVMLDEGTIERLLTEPIDPDDAPPGYEGVARLLGVVAQIEDRPDMALEERHVAAAVAIRRTEAAARAASLRRPSKTKASTSRRLAGLVLAAALAGSTGLAFADALPDPAQDAFADVLRRVGITVPGGDREPEPPEGPASTGEEISDIATSTDASGVEKGAEISSTASGGRSRAGHPGGPPPGSKGGPPGSKGHPSPVAGRGGTGTADAASGSASEVGTDRANERSNGRSAAGSANAATAPGKASAAAGPPARGGR
jgi:hypothetical protein